jgi:hypothetical protein
VLGPSSLQLGKSGYERLEERGHLDAMLARYGTPLRWAFMPSAKGARGIRRTDITELSASSMTVGRDVVDVGKMQANNASGGQLTFSSYTTAHGPLPLKPSSLKL